MHAHRRVLLNKQRDVLFQRLRPHWRIVCAQGVGGADKGPRCFTLQAKAGVFGAGLFDAQEIRRERLFEVAIDRQGDSTARAKRFEVQ